MTLEEIKQRVAEIAAKRHCDASAHILEDKLRSDFIRHIASHAAAWPLREMAQAVLETDDIEFSRWYE